MGIGLGVSRSSYDRVEYIDRYLPAPQNPDPKKFKVLDKKSCGKFLILRIKYDGCSNYEGEKILVYEGVTWPILKRQKSLDPHFSQSRDFYSPIARFEPTDLGWSRAVLFCQMYEFLKKII
jgi:hypothetical protein